MTARSMHRLLLALLALLSLATPAQAQKRIAFSFDDVPRRPGGFMTVEERTTRLHRRAAPRAASARPPSSSIRAISTEPYGAGGEARIDRYVRAGHVIANHSYSHPSLSRIGAEAYLADIDRAARLAAWPARLSPVVPLSLPRRGHRAQRSRTSASATRSAPASPSAACSTPM